MSRTYRTRLGGTLGKGRRQLQSGIRVIPGNRYLSRDRQDLQAILLGSAVLACAERDSEFRELLREFLVARVTDPADMALFPEFFPPSCRTIQ